MVQWFFPPLVFPDLGQSPKGRDFNFVPVMLESNFCICSKTKWAAKKSTKFGLKVVDKVWAGLTPSRLSYDRNHKTDKVSR